MRENFLTPDLSISDNFEQLWFLWQKPPPPDEGNFFDFRSIHLRQFWATLDFVAEKPSPPRWGTIFDTRSIYLRHFWATLVFVAETPPRGWGKFFGYQIYPFEAILSNFGFCGRKAPLDEGNFFDTRSIHLRQFWASLVFVAEKPPPPGWGKFFLTPDLSIWGNFEQLWILWQKSSPQDEEIFWHQIYPFEAILNNFGFCGRKATPLKNERNFFDTRSIHFRQFWATLVFVAEKPPPPRWGNFFLTSDLSIWGNFEQLWFLWQKSPPPGWGTYFWHQIYPFEAILSNFGFCDRKAPSPKREIFWH